MRWKNKCQVKNRPKWNSSTFIVDFLRSPRLKDHEDQGMFRLLAFRDLIRELRSPPPAVEEGAVGEGVVKESAVGERAVIVAPVTSEEPAPSDVTIKLTSPSVVTDNGSVTGIIMAEQCKEEVQTALQNNDLALAAKKALEYLDCIYSAPLNIAITGESGAGKSSLVNALRGIKNKTPESAPTGVKETTMEPTVYPHPQNPNVKIWDLPGIGTTKFTADKYLQHVGFEKYDFFIIVSSDRFKENDAKLAQEIQKMNKNFYFVRSKIDHNIRDEKRDDPNLNEEDLLKTIRDDCTEGLQKLGIQCPKVFLVCGLRLHLYEFSLLWKTLEKELPQHQRDALLLALPNISQ
ncbi:interferon-inducible GTPase 5-like [Boleophthalmus pectinirostris]|uniref:interferon-inducible GTPase 5-like n=1 Tax=Boleophthalmus pectinirostris TaxID=150288 RepID=UPI00242BD02C|nr:interferon-inducible GTPase 5-like [Boleophthalmus pectinirostris]